MLGADVDFRPGRDNRVTRHMIFAQIAEESVTRFIDGIAATRQRGFALTSGKSEEMPRP